MDLNYKILWFEDTPESFATLSRQTERYINKKNLLCRIDHVWGYDDFDINNYDLNLYEIIVVDLQLSNESKGYDVINAIRSSNYVNDVLFYSSAGIPELEKQMRENRLEGVFLCEREHSMFMEKIKHLIDKSVRRSENIINIRGIVMDETSEFDSQMKEIVLVADTFATSDEKAAIKAYVCELVAKKVERVGRWQGKYPADSDWSITDLLNEYDFDSMMRAKLINKIVNMQSNERINQAVNQCAEILPEVFSGDGQAAKFAHAYDKKVIQYRNRLAHVKQRNAESPVSLGEIDGEECKCDAAFCAMMRRTLIQYGEWFDRFYHALEETPV